MKRDRRSFSPPQKAEVVRRHLIGKERVSDLAEELKVQPSQIHGWVKLVLDQAEKAFDRGAARSTQRVEGAKDQKIVRLEEKLVKKNEVVAELMEAHVQLKKELGEL
jgi:transposase-like protein